MKYSKIAKAIILANIGTSAAYAGIDQVVGADGYSMPKDNFVVNVIDYWVSNSSEKLIDVCLYSDADKTNLLECKSGNNIMSLDGGTTGQGTVSIKIPGDKLPTGEFKIWATGSDGNSNSFVKAPESWDAFSIKDGGTTEPNKPNEFDYETSITGSTQQPSNADSSPVIRAEGDNLKTAGYFSDWAQYDRQFALSDVDETSYTDLVYSFFGICGDRGLAGAEVGSTEKSQKVKESCDSLEKPEGSVVSLDHWGSFQSANAYDPGYDYSELYDGNLTKEKWSQLNSSNVRGVFGELVKLKTDQPDINIGLSIGGWTLSEPFHRVAADETLRQNFADSIVELLNKFKVNGKPLFTSFDIDWEFPGHGGESGAFEEDDGSNFVSLLQTLRDTLDSNGYNSIQLSSAVGATSEYINYIGKDNYLKLAGENGLLDKLYLMNYDYWGAWDTTLGHHSNLYGSSVSSDSSESSNSASKAVELLASWGVEKSRMMLGVANYSRGKQGTITVDGQPFEAESVTDTLVFGTYPDAPSVVEGYDLYGNMSGSDLRGDNGFQLYTDVDNNADYYYNANTNVYYSIDTPRTAAMKAKYVKDNGLAGTFVWTVEQDYKGITVDSINLAYGHQLSGSDSYTVEQIEEFSQTCGVNVSNSDCADLIDPPELISVAAIDGPTPKASQKVVTTITTTQGQVHKINTVFNNNPESYGWQHVVANNINKAGIRNVKAGEKTADGEISVVNGSGYRNLVWGPEGTKVDMELLEDNIVLLSSITGQTPNSNQKIVTTITTVDGDTHKVETVFNNNPQSYGWQQSVANNINNAGIENVKAGEQKSDGSIVVINGSSYRNKIWGPQGTSIKQELVEDQVTMVSGIYGPTPEAGQTVTTTIELPDGNSTQVETKFNKKPESYGWQHVVANKINAMKIPGIIAGEQKSNGDIKVIVGSSYRNKVWGPEGTIVTYEIN
ncbi:glycosyl hydrolase family 18 protein [Vibrio sp. CyArs1]|uniref:glycosyl hydrolase family 18 protein n=1 Tax=Vibrio sp. CyArs1 TaxID=2682577 RepID=UPI001F055319|nr:glycosyl hydrolase family 18 protein [Vibrio sp. CyArs1]